MTRVDTTVLFTDIEGSTQRWDRRPEQMRAALERHDELMRAAFEGQGQILKHTGDGLIVTAPDPARLLAGAVDAQRRLGAADWSDVGGLRVRMGLHHGSFHSRDDDLFGSDMNLAVRIMAGAVGGQIVASATTLASATLPPGCVAEDLGRFRFRGVHEPVAVVTITYPGGDVDPGAYRSSEADLGNLQAGPDHLVGRAAELRTVAELIRSPGLVTLVGPGGVGKTTTAVAVAADARPVFPDGLWFVDLTRAAAEADPLQEVARVLGLGDPSDGDLAGLVADALTARSMLVVLDNCEHVMEAVRGALASVLRAHGRATVLATSQEAIGHPTERVMALSPLGVGDAAAPAVELFVERARTVDPAYSPGPEERAAILDLCRQLDGLPLAIELAASRATSLGVRDLLAHLGQRFRLLRESGTGRHDALERTIAWSHDLLEEAEQALLRRISVFEGPFGLSQAAAAGGLDALDASEGLARLVRRSLLTRAPGAGEPSFRLLESVRHFALDRLTEAGEQPLTVQLVTEHVGALVVGAREGIDGPEQLDWFDRIDREAPAVRIAIDHLLAGDPPAALDLLVALYQYWMARGRRDQALRWLLAALDGAGDADPGLVSRGLADAAAFAYFTGDLAASRALCERSIAVSEASALPPRPTALLRLGALQAFEGDQERALAAADRALALLDADHDPHEPPETMAAIGAFLAVAGDAPRGVEVCRAAIGAHRAPSPTTVASDLLNLGYSYRRLDPGRSVAAYLEARQQAQAVGGRFYAATAGMGAGLTLCGSGQGDEALPVLAEALPLARDLGMQDEVLVMLQAVARVLRARGTVEGDLLLLIADREQRARGWVGGPTLGRPSRRSVDDVAEELGDDFADLASAAGEMDVDEAIGMVERLAGTARSGAQAPSIWMGTSASNDAP